MIKLFFTMLWEYWKGIFLFLWQLPQNLLGILWLNINLIFYYGISNAITLTMGWNEVCVYTIPSKSLEGVSLGKYIIVSENFSDDTIMHEYGHCKQSMYLGWLYLPIIGLPSLIWNCIYQYTNKDYYWLFCEKWADKLGGVKR